MCIIKGKYGLNFDPKHLIKRFRGIFISEKNCGVTLIKRPITKQIISKYYGDEKNLEAILNPKDYQNVPLASQLINMFANTEPKIDNVDAFSSDIIAELELLRELSKLILSFFAKTTIDLQNQLIDLATLSHLLLHIFRRNRKYFNVAIKLA